MSPHVSPQGPPMPPPQQQPAPRPMPLQSSRPTQLPIHMAPAVGRALQPVVRLPRWKCMRPHEVMHIMRCNLAAVRIANPYGWPWWISDCMYCVLFAAARFQAAGCGFKAARGKLDEFWVIGIVRVIGYFWAARYIDDFYFYAKQAASRKQPEP